MGTGGIPFEALDRYAIRYGVEGDEFEELAHLIRAMDAEYLTWANEKRDG